MGERTKLYTLKGLTQISVLLASLAAQAERSTIIILSVNHRWFGNIDNTERILQLAYRSNPHLS